MINLYNIKGRYRQIRKGKRLKSLRPIKVILLKRVMLYYQEREREIETAGDSVARHRLGQCCYLGESGVRGNRPGDELVRGDGPDQGGNRNPPALCLLSGVRNMSWCVQTWGDGCCWGLAWRSDQNLERGLLHNGVVWDCGKGDGGGVAGGGDRLGDHTGQDGDLIISIAFSSRYLIYKYIIMSYYLLLYCHIILFSSL